jgi:hypothetical protein
MKLNFNFNLTDLEGKELLERDGSKVNAGKLLANSLVQQTKGDAIKYFEWALALNKGEILDLDTSDQDVLKSFIKDSEAIIILAKGPLLQVFTKVQDKK